ncbi:FAD/NAD(P)-binding protein [Pedobacter ureilyticus]|uniref:FAD/NAD(P)-binding protein n=1 Tax=Pedobacter ureilyticus TaxID=1393051 RepID=A0ABW9JB19_9SPHI|nr:FAD/NAD(P)-binding protein [Pedobacter helvus]
MQQRLSIAIVGGGATGLLMFKMQIHTGHSNITIKIFERKEQLGAGISSFALTKKI